MKTSSSRLFRFALALVCTGTFAAGAIDQDLGQGLHFLRPSDLKTEAAAVTAALEKPALVLDLRNLGGDAETARALGASLGRSAQRPKSLRLVLVNAGTDPALAAAAAGRPGTILIAPRSAELPADIVVNASVEDDRKAFDAAAQGVPLEKLINGTPEKKRFDEASLAQGRQNGHRPADNPPPPAAPPANGSNGGTPTKEVKAAPPPTDVLLQRAVHLHRGLVALKKLP